MSKILRKVTSNVIKNGVKVSSVVIIDYMYRDDKVIKMDGIYSSFKGNTGNTCNTGNTDNVAGSINIFGDKL